MTVRTDELVRIAQRGQEATTQAVRTWAELAQSYTTNITPEQPLPAPADMHAAVDTWFALAGRLLAEQQAFTKTLIDAGTEAVDVVAEQARAVRSTV